MKIVLIPDKFKGSATAEEVINAIEKGIKKAEPTAETYSVMASDGGDGFLDAVSNYIEAEEVTMETVDPLNRKMTTSYLFDAKENAAYIEMAKASGMELLIELERNPMKTSTYGTGLLIKDAIARGAKSIYVGMGGSATNDGGIGMAKAMGYRFRDGENWELEPIGENLIKIDGIAGKTPEAFSKVSFFAINDVQNPLFGIEGAAFVYARQKGATDEIIKDLDQGLVHLDKMVQIHLSKSKAHVLGAGAAGGAGYGLKTFFNAEFISGIQFLLKLGNVPKLLESNKIDYIITGEGKIDDQTLQGKLIKGVVNMGMQYKIPVVAVCGKLDVGKAKLKDLGLHDALQVSDTSKSFEYNMNHAPELIEKTVYEYFKG